MTIAYNAAGICFSNIVVVVIEHSNTWRASERERERRITQDFKRVVTEW